MSKYQSVYNDIKKKIDSKIYKRNDELPSENELMKTYNFSKDTIRKALSLLELDGYIQKIKGKNSIVLGHGRTKNNYLGRIKTSSELNIDGKYDITTKLINLYIVQDELQIMNIFNASKNDDFYRVERSRSINGETLEYEISYFDRKLVPFINKEIAESSIYKYIEQELGLKITHSRREVSFRYANDDEKKYMHLNDYDMVAVVESITYLSNGNILQYGSVSYRPDKFTFVSMAKR
ncbi:UTRA domain-containing protein [Gemelliphila palaticanis]|uniref:UTRA domain-containing protein n=1 Tax=Gemelliphila palaticanis TaxID=81950 RepID=A0ABX2SYP3_9BACL|nr:UTRA domain-containing protein [Gemella palaticanis]MBF0715478.1 UTRA domain-containing protein [Gemella palaticanis]NYS47408.1 UTRA domain-containing protein [Gemella palaticanis]